MHYNIPATLLSTKNSKTIKGEKLGYTTYIMYLAPHKQNSKKVNICAKATNGCATACLFGSGAARFTNVQKGKINKTEYLIHDFKGFKAQLFQELTRIVRLHSNVTGEKQVGRTGKIIRYKKFAVRLNGTSDIPWERLKIKDKKNIFELFPEVQFYDYTKLDERFNNIVLPENYHLTFSRSEENDKECIDILNRGYNVAYVFGVRKEQDLPDTYKGFKVINGDESDLRFLDEENVIIGLKYKFLTGKGTAGKNKENIDNNDFLIDVTKKEVKKLVQLEK